MGHGYFRVSCEPFISKNFKSRLNYDFKSWGVCQYKGVKHLGSTEKSASHEKFAFINPKEGCLNLG